MVSISDMNVRAFKSLHTPGGARLQLEQHVWADRSPSLPTKDCIGLGALTAAFMSTDPLQNLRLWFVWFHP